MERNGCVAWGVCGMGDTLALRSRTRTQHTRTKTGFRCIILRSLRSSITPIRRGENAIVSASSAFAFHRHAGREPLEKCEWGSVVSASEAHPAVIQQIFQ